MKKSFLSALILLVLGAGACKKEAPDQPEKIVMTSTTPAARVLSKTNLDDAEYRRVLAALTGYNEYVLVMCELSYGQHSYRPSSDYGFTASDSAGRLMIRLNNESFQQSRGWEGCLSHDERLEKFFGKKVQVALLDGPAKAAQELYVPQPLAATGIYRPVTASNTTGRKGNTLEWTPDPNNATKKIVIAYQLYKSNTTMSMEPLGEEQYLIVDDNGSFNMDPFITKEAKIYSLVFWRGNAMTLQSGSKKILFAMVSADEHLYHIRD